VTPIVAVETALRLSLDPTISTKVLQLVHGLVDEVFEKQAKHAGKDAFVAIGTVCELTGIGSHHTVPDLVKLQEQQVGILQRTWNGRPGGFVTDEDGEGRGVASHWALTDVRVDEIPLRYADGSRATAWQGNRLRLLLSPANEHLKCDAAYRAVMIAVAVQGVGDVPLTARLLQQWAGMSRTMAYRALAHLKSVGWWWDGMLRLAHALEDPDNARLPVLHHVMRVKAWIARLLAAQRAFADAVYEQMLAASARYHRPGRFDKCFQRLKTQVSLVVPSPIPREIQ